MDISSLGLVAIPYAAMKHLCLPFRGRIPGRILLACSVLLPLGCAQSDSNRVDKALTQYRSGQYQAALDTAQSARFSGSGTDRAEASYIAGLAAAELKQTATARHLLEAAADSGNTAVAGKANISLATVLMDSGEPLRAARRFDTAAGQLSGEESSRATFLAGVAYRDAGHAELARRRFANASAETAGDFSKRADQEIQNTGFAIQAGAYANRANAVARAQTVSASARQKGFPEARIVEAQRQGQLLNIVQVGSYSTRSDAEFARRRLGLTGTRGEQIAVVDTNSP